MKRIIFSRKTLIRAIRAAAVALYFAAITAAHAQTATGDGNGNVTITGSGSATFNLGPSSSPPLAAGGTLTIAAGANASQPLVSTSAYEIQINTVATTTNSGYIGNANSALGSCFGIEYTSVSTAGNVTVQNTSTGTITASAYAGPAAAVYIQDVTHGSVAVTNNGQITTQNDAALGGVASTLSGVYANDTYASGTITLTNTGTISAVYALALNAYGANLATSGSGAITVTNGGMITATAGQFTSAGINATASGAASISVSNTGTISGITSSNGGYGIGISGSNTSGQITITNSGTGSITGTGQHRGIGIEAASTSGNISITNENSASVSAQTMGTSSQYYGIGIKATTTSGSITINNSASISGSGYGNGYGIATATGAGTVSITNAGTLQGSSSAIYTNVFGYGIYATSGYAGAGNAISIVNGGSGTISGSGFYNGTGIYANTTSSGAISITNENSASISGSSDGNAPINIATSYGIHATSASGTITVNNLAGASISASNDASAYGIAAASSGPVNITNNGTIVSTNQFPGIGIAYGIDVSGSSSSLITNTGSITATSDSSYGILLNSIGQVHDSGSITADTAISVPSGSSVTLTGRPTISGTIMGGPTSASTSQLIFAQTVSSANLAAAKSELNTEIADYAAQNGGNYTFTFDGLTYDVSNFDYDGGVIDDLTALISRLYRNTPGFYSEGLVLDTLPSGNAQASKLLTALGNVSDAGVVNALSELSPKTLEVFSTVANNGATFNAAKINNHLANERDGLTGFDATALNVQDSGMDPTLNQVRDHLLAYNPVATPGLMSDSGSLFGLGDPKDMKNAQVNTMPADRWSSFIAGDVILADLSHNANLDDADYTTGNITAGADYRLDEHFTVGALFNYAHTDANLDSRGSSATVDSYSPGLYASYVDKGWYGNFLGAYGRNAYTSDRMVDIPGLQGDNHGGTSGNQGTVNLTGGYEFQKGAFKFGPVASVQYVHLSIDSMQEEGPTALTIDSQDEDSFRSQLGVEGRFNANVGPVSLTPHVSLSWQHEYLDSSRGINAQFTGTGGGSFVTETDKPDRDAAFIDVGLDAAVCKNVTLFVDYETQVGQQNFFAQSAEGGVKIGF